MTHTALETAAEAPISGADDTFETLVREARAAYDGENFDAAIQACERLLQSRPGSAEALLLLGLTSLGLDEPMQAIDLLKRAQDADPATREYADALACVLAYLGEANESLYYAKLATVLTPHPLGEALLPKRFTDYFTNLNYARPHLYRTQAEATLARGQAADAAALCEKQLALTPGDIRTLRVFARALLAAGQTTRAIATMHAAIHDQPVAEDYRLLTEALAQAGRTEEALFALDRAEARRPSDCTIAQARVRIVRTRDGEAGTAYAEACAGWFSRFAPGTSAAGPAFANPLDPDRPLRIGYVGAGLHAGPLAGPLAAVLAHHDRNAVEACLYPTGTRHDMASETLMRGATRWTELAGIDPETAATIMRGDGLDIAVDLTGHGEDSPLLAFGYGPAPVRLGWLGPRPASPAAYDAHLVTADEGTVGALAFELPFVPAGLPEPAADGPLAATGVPTVGIVAPMGEIGTPTMALCAAVMDAVPAARLLIANPAGHDEECTARLYELASHAGLRQRTIVAELDDPRATAVHFYEHIDLVLDPRPNSLFRETCEALWMGVPVLTFSEAGPRGNAAARALTAAGLTDWVFADEGGLCAAAVALAGDRPALSAHRRSLRETVRGSALCDVEGFTRRIEAACRHHWRRWCARSVSC